ncbi:MAG TPA: tRNA (adenosine(37)-N6)-threonylcarbamoyltransferase complex ATPase subunit type 1 TsaE [Acidimicrobiales bacterium]|nr:tRNA (adenosine(37)-N6)-threonylcarbamoyltransferase complex ATPase subunit type 1 TsaE [Acidimicrobiales bacterium]
MIRVRTTSVDDTRQLAASVAGVVRAGDLILLAGDLGSGKTAWVQGFGKALGAEDRITSPTFTLVNHYPARLPILHADVYRLDHLQEVVDLGLPELLDEGAVAVIEWGDLAEPVLPADYLSLQFEFAEADDERLVALHTVGRAWTEREPGLGLAVAPWVREAG